MGNLGTVHSAQGDQESTGAIRMKTGDWYTDGYRDYRIGRVTNSTIEYLDCYPVMEDDGSFLRYEIIPRLTSRIQWELDMKSDELQEGAIWS